MADVIEEKWPKGIVGSITFLFILILMLATMAPNNLIDRVMQLERTWGNALLPQQDMDRVVGTTNTFYQTMMIDSGAKEMVSNLFMPRGNRTVDAFEEKVGWWFNYLADRGVALQKIIYQMTYRVVLAMYWVPFFVVVVVPAIFAGYMRWNAKRHSFDYASPFLNNHSAAMLIWGVIGTLISVLMPLPLPPLVICTLLIAAMPFMLSVLISNLPKKI